MTATLPPPCRLASTGASAGFRSPSELLAAGDEPISAELGSQQELPGGGDAGDMTWPGLLNNPSLLGGVITVLVVLLALGLYQAVQRVDAVSQESRDDSKD